MSNNKPKINKFTAIEVDKETIQIGFKYNVEIVKAVGKLNYRIYNRDNHLWKIYKTEVLKFINSIKAIENVDVTELRKWITSSKISEPEIVIKDFSYMDKKPFKHQLSGCKFLLKEKKALLADEMGGGKTMTSILACENINGKKLIVCPASLKLNWQKEIKIVNKNATIYVVNGEGYQLSKIELNDYIIMNYDMVSKYLIKILTTDYEVIILDESHYIKGVKNTGKPSSHRAKAVLEIKDNINYRFELTGTPIPNHTKDIYNQLKFIDSPIAKNFFDFASKYCDPSQSIYGWCFDGSSNREELNEKLQQKMLRRLKKDLLDLPEKNRSFIPLNVNLREYNNLVNEYMENRSTYMTQGEHLVKLNAMRMEIAYLKIKDSIEIAENILEQDQQVVIITNFQRVVDKLKEKFIDVCCTITGSDSVEAREKSIDDFQSGDKKVIICNVIAGGVGVTLTASQTILFNDYDWCSSSMIQCEDRIHRIGQKKKCNIYYMTANGTIDEKITKMLSEKLENINKVIDNEEDGNFFEEVIKNFNKL